MWYLIKASVRASVLKTSLLNIWSAGAQQWAICPVPHFGMLTLNLSPSLYVWMCSPRHLGLFSFLVTPNKTGHRKFGSKNNNSWSDWRRERNTTLNTTAGNASSIQNECVSVCIDYMSLIVLHNTSWTSSCFSMPSRKISMETTGRLRVSITSTAPACTCILHIFYAGIT